MFVACAFVSPKHFGWYLHRIEKDLTIRLQSCVFQAGKQNSVSMIVTCLYAPEGQQSYQKHMHDHQTDLVLLLDTGLCLNQWPSFERPVLLWPKIHLSRG